MSVFDDSLLLSPLRRGYRNLKWKVQAAQARCVALNYFGALVPITAHADVWLILGITGLLLIFFLSYDKCANKYGDLEVLSQEYRHQIWPAY